MSPSYRLGLKVGDVLLHVSTCTRPHLECREVDRVYRAVLCHVTEAWRSQLLAAKSKEPSCLHASQELNLLASQVDNRMVVTLHA